MECTRRGALGKVAVEFGCLRVGAAAVAELRRSRRRAIERGQKKRARAPAGHGEAICVPGWARGQVGEAVDDGIDFGWRRRAAARGEGKPDGGELGTELGRVGVLEKGVEEQLAKGIGTGWHGEGELRRGAAAVVRCRVEEEEGTVVGGRGERDRFVAALAHRREGDA
jgi:hypothetical protein